MFKISNISEILKKIAKNALIYGIVILSVAASFFIGLYYNKLFVNSDISPIEINKISKSQVNIAIDENNHLIIINNKTGSYIIYEDSIGHTIFNLYAKNIWGQHTQSP